MRVLIVDDSEQIRRLLRRTIEMRTTFTIIGEACNGAEAVDSMEQLQPDVIVMDINMPVMDGVEAARLIKSAFPAVYIVVYTSNNPNEVSDLLDEGVIFGTVYKTATNDLVGQLKEIDSRLLPLNRLPAGVVGQSSDGHAGFPPTACCADDGANCSSEHHHFRVNPLAP